MVPAGKPVELASGSEAISVGTSAALPLDVYRLGRRIDLVKLDVERAEMRVLKGGEATFRQSRPSSCSRCTRPCCGA